MPVPRSPTRTRPCYLSCSGVGTRTERACIEDPRPMSVLAPGLLSAVVCSSADPGGRSASGPVCRDRLPRPAILAGAASGSSLAPSIAARCSKRSIGCGRSSPTWRPKGAGICMTLDPAYLKAYGVSDESVRREAQALQTLVADDPLQSLRAGHLALTVAATLREIDEHRQDGRHVRAGGAGDDPQHGRDPLANRPDGGPRALSARGSGGARRRTRATQDLADRRAPSSSSSSLAGAALALARLEARRRRKATEENIQLQSDLAAAR